MGKDENLRKLNENQMKSMNYTLNLHLKRHGFYTEPVIRPAVNGERKIKKQRRDRLDLFFAFLSNSMNDERLHVLKQYIHIYERFSRFAQHMQYA